MVTRKHRIQVIVDQDVHDAMEEHGREIGPPTRRVSTVAAMVLTREFAGREWVDGRSQRVAESAN